MGFAAALVAAEAAAAEARTTPKAAIGGRVPKVPQAAGRARLAVEDTTAGCTGGPVSPRKGSQQIEAKEIEAVRTEFGER
eukprot:COSAG04_NODE_9472_length_861_cov_0.904199_2_plen_80_part_00